MDLLPHTFVVEITAELRVRIVDLETLIAIKAERATLVDVAALPTLRATLEEIRRRDVETSTTSGCG